MRRRVEVSSSQRNKVVVGAASPAKQHASLFRDLPIVTTENFWLIPTELLVPAALEGQLLSERAQHLETKIVVEGANGPTTPAADDILMTGGS